MRLTATRAENSLIGHIGVGLPAGVKIGWVTSSCPGSAVGLTAVAGFIGYPHIMGVIGHVI